MAIRRRGFSSALSFLAVLMTLLPATASMAQPPSQTTTQPAPQAQPPATEQAPITVPAGTRLNLVLTHPVDSKTMRHNDEIYAQTTAPVLLGDQMVIPAGTFVQGPVEKVSRHGTRAEFRMQSPAVLFPNGYVVHLAGTVNIESEEDTAWPNPGGGATAGMILAPVAGAGLGALIGSTAHTSQTSTLGGTSITTPTHTGLAIGTAVGLASGGVVSLVLLLRSHSFYVLEGAPMEMTLTQPLTLAANQVADTLRQAQSQPPMPIPRVLPPAQPLPVDHGTCYTPDTPGTPPTIIPGTPPVGNIPGTPDTVIPGTPSIPGTPYPCP
jgi:hypothetical protein